jgi:hypothetical protein
MRPRTAKEKSAEKIKLLRNPVVSAAFAHYFRANWQAQKMLNELQVAGANVQHLREWALWSFHPLGADEAEEKQKRGRLTKTRLKKALIGYKSAIACFSAYASAPHFGWSDSRSTSDRFQRLVRMNQYLARETSAVLERIGTSGVYKTKRLGVKWNIHYLYLSKVYIAAVAHWDERSVLDALTHLITAGKKSVRNKVPRDLRSLLRKTLRTFENDSENATIVGRLQRAVANPDVLTEFFPPLIANAD